MAPDPNAFMQFAAAIRKAPRVHSVAHGLMRGQAQVLRTALIHVGKATFYSDGGRSCASSARTAVLAGGESSAAARTADWTFHTPNQSILQRPSHVAAAAFISGLHQVLLQPDEDEAAERYQLAYEGLLPESKGTRKAHTVA